MLESMIGSERPYAARSASTIKNTQFKHVSIYHLLKYKPNVKHLLRYQAKSCLRSGLVQENGKKTEFKPPYTRSAQDFAQ